MLGFFDEYIVVEGWFAPEIQPLGWFEPILLNTSSGGSYQYGYTTIGATPFGLGPDSNLGSRFTASQSGTLTKIWAYGKLGVAGSGATMRVAIFENTGSDTIGTLVAESSGSVSVTSTTPQWWGCDISASITSGVDYWLFAWVDTSAISGGYFDAYADGNAIANSIVVTFGNSYPDWSTVGDGTNENYDLGYMSIYADVTTSSGGGAIDGSASGVGTASATIQAKGLLSGSINGIATTNAVIKGRTSLSATSNGTSTTSATLTPRTYIVGTSSGVASVSGTIKGKTSLIGAINCTSSVSGVIGADGRLIGAITSTSTASAFIKGYAYIQGSASGSSTASLSTNNRIQGESNGTTTAVGSVNGKGRLLGAVNSTSTTTANIVGKTRLIGSVTSVSSVSGRTFGYGDLIGLSTGSSTTSGYLRNKVKRRYFITS